MLARGTAAQEVTSIAKAEELGTRMDIAVVDAGANLKAFARMDGVWLGSIDIAITKARIARFFDMPTGDIGALSQPGGPLYQIEASNDGLITFPGGLPLRTVDGAIVGAVGVSGSTIEAGAAALGRIRTGWAQDPVSQIPSFSRQPKCDVPSDRVVALDQGSEPGACTWQA